MLNRLGNDKKGFTLIELMIVVAIIGIMAAIAIPNFLKFQAKSKTSEVKMNLKAIYTAQTSFHYENNQYGDFIQINWVPMGKTLYYSYTLKSSIDPAPQASVGTIVVESNRLDIRSTKGVTGIMNFTVPNPPFTITTLGLASDNSTFIVGAAGDISPRNSLADCWVINDLNVLYHTQNGI